MTAHLLIWVGLICCLAALMIQLFPNAAFSMGVDVSSSWLALAFGVFLIALSAVFSRPPGRGEQ